MIGPRLQAGADQSGRKEKNLVAEFPLDRQDLISAVVPEFILQDSPTTEMSGRANTRSCPIVYEVVLSVNDVKHAMRIDSRMTLLDALREECRLTGSKKGCDQGQCGACTIHMNGERQLACLTLAIAAQGHSITTIEGLAQNQQLHPMQQAFIDHDGFQCGYCTSGQIMSAVACVWEGHAESDDQVREYMSGNLCRCAAYPNIVAAIKQAKLEMEEG